MATIELTVDAAYLSGSKGWGPEEGIREIIQNAHDATVEHGGELRVEHSDDRLVVENTGAKLSRQALLIGNTSKRDRHDLIGQWGEGLKFGSLALVRGGHKVTIRTGPEVWTPFIAESETYGGATVLKVKIEGGREDRRRVRVEIEGISKDFWNAIKDRFLFLYKRDVPQVECERGALLTSEKFKGRVYVKGIMTMQDERLEYGYNLFQVELDRDRRVIEHSELANELRLIWKEALARQPELADDAYAMLVEDRAGDVDGFYNRPEELPAAALDRCAALFTDKHGPDAVPVTTTDQSAKVAHFGKKGVMVGYDLLKVLTQRLDSADQVEQKLAHEVTRIYAWFELDLQEQKNLVRAMELVDKAAGLVPSEVDVVDFRNSGHGGMFKDARVLVAKKSLQTRSDALRVCVHETAHRKGVDGSKEHVQEIERIWAAVAEGLAGE